MGTRSYVIPVRSDAYHTCTALSSHGLFVKGSQGILHADIQIGVEEAGYRKRKEKA